MAITEVFPNPTVKQVIFQIRFPNLFYMENKISEIQLKIMKEFPQSSLLLRSQVVVADLGSKSKFEDLPKNDVSKKIWQFRSPKGYELNILPDALDINSNFHKTYDNEGSEHKFRDIIKFVLENFLSITNIPLINRIGLRYIDHCPIPKLENKIFKAHYNTTFPLGRFNIKDAEAMSFVTMVKRKKYTLRYSETLVKQGKAPYLILDFDGSAINIQPKNYLEITDELRVMISDEFQNSIKEPVYKFMRKKGKK